MKKQFSRMITVTSSSVGAAAGATAYCSARPDGVVGWRGRIRGIGIKRLLLRRQDCIQDPEEVERLFKAKHDKLEKEVISSAYELLDRTEHCTNEELKEAYRAAVLRYHPDKCQGSEEERQKNHRITQGIVAAYTLLKEKRGRKQ